MSKRDHSKRDDDRKKRRVPLLFAEGFVAPIGGEHIRAFGRFEFGEGFPPERPARQRLAGELVTSPVLLDLLGRPGPAVVAESERERVERVANEYVAERRERLRHAGRLEPVDADAVRAADHRRQVEHVAARLAREDLRRERTELAALLGDASR